MMHIPPTVLLKPLVKLYEFARTFAQDKLLRAALDVARRSTSASTCHQVTMPLRNFVDRRAARDLERKGRLTIEGNVCLVPVNLVPLAVRQAMAMRALCTPRDLGFFE